MNPLRFVPPVGALAGAAILLTPSTGEAWNLTGWTLGTGQRDFRVFNNFTDPQANDNTNEHGQFPGYVGADLAIWKGCVEWSSRAHGNGNGDPSQPVLGSGGANFDPSFQGNANSAGVIGDNTHAELAGCSGGVLAFTESFTNGSGWRISYYSCWTWFDGPGTAWNGGNGRFDLQGVACHEYGHALGLDHTNAGGATMQASTSDGKAARSIEADDIAGIQAAYGAASPTKPVIDSTSFDGTTLTIDGSNFGQTSNNQVWFTQAGSGGDGTPVKVLGQQGINGGTRIEVVVPGAAGPGDVMINRVPGQGDTISNPYPFDPSDITCPQPSNYCTPIANPTGQPATIAFVGSQTVADNDVTLTCTNLPASTFGLFFYGQNQTQVAGGDGNICIGSPFYRLPAVQADATGFATFTYDLTQPPVPQGQISAGETWNFSFWYRQVSPAGYNFSDGVEVEFCN